MKRIDPWARAFAAAAVIWALALPVAALARERSVIGSPARVAADVVYVAGAVVCHQQPQRSFSLAKQRLPVCARCTGIYGSAAVAAVLLSAGCVRRRWRWLFFPRQSKAQLLAMLAVCPTAMTLLWEWTIGITPSNAVRAAAGVPIGIFVSWLLVAAGRPKMQSG
jgi:uncharacterized membrane protein